MSRQSNSNQFSRPPLGRPPRPSTNAHVEGESADERSSLLVPESERPAAADMRPANPSAPPAHHQKSHSLHAIPTGRRKQNAHHRRKSSVSQLFESFSGSLESISEELVLEARVVRDAWRSEMENAHEGRTFYLDMTMTRSLSILPEELPDLAEAATGTAAREPAPPDASIVWRYVSLLGAVMAVSSNGTALALLHGVHPALKLYWRMVATSLALLPLAAKDLCKGGLPELTGAQCFTFAQAVFCFFCHSLLYYTALQHTSIGNAVIGANSQALLLILGKLIVGDSVLALEGTGVVIAFVGCIMCSQDESEGSSSTPADDNSMGHFGDMLALGSAAFGVGYLTFAKAVRPHVPVIIFMFFIMSLGSFLVLFYLVVMGHHIEFNSDPYVGIFGWVNLAEHRLWILIHIAIICNVFGAMGFVRAMQYFDNIIIAVATLLEPMTATLIAFALRVGGLPGVLGWIGNALVVLGTLLVVYPSMDKPIEH